MQMGVSCTDLCIGVDTLTAIVLPAILDAGGSSFSKVDSADQLLSLRLRGAFATTRHRPLNRRPKNPPHREDRAVDAVMPIVHRQHVLRQVWPDKPPAAVRPAERVGLRNVSDALPPVLGLQRAVGRKRIR